VGPQRELDRLNASLSLLFDCQRAFMADSELERARSKSRIPGNLKNLQWAEERYKEALRNQKDMPPSYGSLQSDPERWKAYIAFEKEIAKEEEEHIQREEEDMERAIEARRKAEEEARRKEIADAAIAEHEAEKKRMENEKRQKEAVLHSRLVETGIAEKQIAAVLAVGPLEIDLTPAPCANDAASEESATFFASFKRRLRKKDHKAVPDPLGENAPDGPYKYEIWLINQIAPTCIQIPVDELGLIEYIARMRNSSEKTWRSFAKLNPWFRAELSRLLQEKESGKCTWSLVSLKWAGKTAGFGKSTSLQVVLKRSPVRPRASMDNNSTTSSVSSSASTTDTNIRRATPSSADPVNDTFEVIEYNNHAGGYTICPRRSVDARTLKQLNFFYVRSVSSFSLTTTAAAYALRVMIIS